MAEEMLGIRVSKLKAVYANAQINYKLVWGQIAELPKGSPEHSSKFAEAANWAGQMHTITELVGCGITARWHAENKPVVFPTKEGKF